MLLQLLLLVSASVHEAIAQTCEDGSDGGQACKCDELCARYGDCCHDAPFFVAEEQHHGASPFSCETMNVVMATGNVYITLNNTSYYMMSTCPPEWQDSDTRLRCEHPDISFRDPLLDVPVTNLETSITYRNWHCASCHGEIVANRSIIWSISFSCNSSYNVSNEERLNHLRYNLATQKWTLDDTEIVSNSGAKANINDCEVYVLAPQMISLRTCDPKMVDMCPDKWTNTSVRDLCETFTNYSCHDSVKYRNYYCGVCNTNGTLDGNCGQIIDIRIQESPFAGLPPDFVILLDWRRLKRDACQQETEKYDPFSKSCRKVFMETEHIPSNDNSSETRSNLSTANSSNFESCLKTSLNPEDYFILDNETMDVFVLLYNLTLESSEYRILNDSSLSICVPFEYGLEEYSSIPAYITVIGLSISVAFLVFHLMVFVLTPKIRNLSSMNLASLSVALLLMYCSFIAGAFLIDTDLPCLVVAAITHYGLLASVSWMLTIAYDISRVIRETTTRLAIASGKHLQRFAFYTVWTWLLPAIITGTALGVEFSDQVPMEFKPGFGTTNYCWFSTAESLLIFTVAPLLLVMILNAAFFSWSAYLIYKSAHEIRHNATTQQDFCLYVRLALIMGLTWIIGLIGGYADSEVVWYLFLLFNTLQGLFIFLAFTCTKKMWHALCKERRILPINKPYQNAKRSAFPGTATTLT